MVVTFADMPISAQETRKIEDTKIAAINETLLRFELACVAVSL